MIDMFRARENSNNETYTIHIHVHIMLYMCCYTCDMALNRLLFY